MGKGAWKQIAYIWLWWNSDDIGDWIGGYAEEQEYRHWKVTEVV